jgi:hypothetical protein
MIVEFSYSSDDAHPALAEFGDDLVVTDGGADVQTPQL